MDCPDKTGMDRELCFSNRCSVTTEDDDYASLPAPETKMNSCSFVNLIIKIGSLQIINIGQKHEHWYGPALSRDKIIYSNLMFLKIMNSFTLY